ncbi:MAG: YfhO family protein [bacterium]
MDNKKIQNWLIGLFLFITGLIFFNGALQPGKILFGTDFFTIYLPFKLFAQEMAVKYHDLPLWMPHLFFGMPLIGSSSLLYYYPTDLLFMFLPIPLQFTYTIDLLIHLLVSFLGMFLFLRQFSIRREAAFFSAVAFTISGFMLSYIYVGHWNNIKAGALIPFIFYFTARGFDNKKMLPFLNAAVLMALQILATGMQIMAYTYLGVLMLAIYKIWIEARNKINYIKPIGLFMLSTLAIIIYASLQLIPSIPYTDYSWRGSFTYSDFVSWSFHPIETLTFFLPRFFGLRAENYYGFMPFNLTTYYFGIISFLLVPFAFVDKKLSSFAKFLTFSSILFLILSFGGFTPIYKLFYYIPVFNQFRNPSRFLYVFTFFIMALSAVGLNNIFNFGQASKNTMLKILTGISVIMGIIFITLSIMFIGNNLTQIVSSLYMTIKKTQISPQILGNILAGIRQDVVYFIFVSAAGLAIIYAFISKKIKNIFLVSIILASINFVDMHRIDNKFIIYEEYKNYVPVIDPVAIAIKQDKDIYRMTDFSFSWSPNRNIYYDIEGLKGIHGLIPKSYLALEKAGLFNILAADSYFNIKYFLMSEDINIPGLYKLLDGKVKVYSNKAVSPRIVFTDKIFKYNTNEEILNYMKSGTYDFKGVLIKDDIDLMPSPDLLSYKIGIQSYTPNRIKMIVETEKDGMLVVKNSYYPEWKAKVDNKLNKIYNVNYAFMGIPLKTGTHDIELYYSKDGFYLGLLLTLIGILFYVIIYFRERKIHKGDK